MKGRIIDLTGRTHEETTMNAGAESSMAEIASARVFRHGVDFIALLDVTQFPPALFPAPQRRADRILNERA